MNEPTTESAATGIRLPDRPKRPYTQPTDRQDEPVTGAPTEATAGSGVRSREPLTRTERLLVTMFVTMFATMLGSVALGFATLSGQILDLQRDIGGLHGEIGGLHGEIGGLRAEMHEEIGGLRAEMHEEIGALRAEMQEEFGALRAEMHEEFREVRREISGLSDRVTRIEPAPPTVR